MLRIGQDDARLASVLFAVRPSGIVFNRYRCGELLTIQAIRLKGFSSDNTSEHKVLAAYRVLLQSSHASYHPKRYAC